MTHDGIKLIRTDSPEKERPPEKLTYWRSSPLCFSISFKGIITEICKGDLGYGDMDRLDGAIHAAIGCKRKAMEKCKLLKVE